MYKKILLINIYFNLELKHDYMDTGPEGTQGGKKRKNNTERFCLNWTKLDPPSDRCECECIDALVCP